VIELRADRAPALRHLTDLMAYGWARSPRRWILALAMIHAFCSLSFHALVAHVGRVAAHPVELGENHVA